jgi:hypothetical protein
MIYPLRVIIAVALVRINAVDRSVFHMISLIVKFQTSAEFTLSGPQFLKIPAIMNGQAKITVRGAGDGI